MAKPFKFRDPCPECQTLTSISRKGWVAGESEGIPIFWCPACGWNKSMKVKKK